MQVRTIALFEGKIHNLGTWHVVRGTWCVVNVSRETIMIRDPGLGFAIRDPWLGFAIRDPGLGLMIRDPWA